MNELLKKLLAESVLTEESLKELQAAVQVQIDEAAKAARAEVEALVTKELNEQWITERETLIEALDAKVTEALAEELKELRTDIESFRDLEVETQEYRVKLKEDMRAQVKTDIKTLIENLDTFLEVRLNAELEELREDIDVVKKNEFGKKVFEAFITEFKQHYAGDDSVEARLSETEQRLADTLTHLEEAEKKASALERSIKMDKVLAPLSGNAREVMEAILKKFDTSMLEEAYKTYVSKVLKETVKTDEKTSEKEDVVLAEGKETKTVSGVVKTGDDKQQLTEAKAIEVAEVKKPSAPSSLLAEMRRLSGQA